jgi:hypothetical protein
MLLENQHRTQSDRPLARTPNIHALGLGLLEHLVAPWTIPRNKRALPLAPQILNLARPPLRQALEALEQIIPGNLRIGNKIHALDLANNTAEQDGACRVTHPRVELAVRLVGPQFAVAKVVARGLRFLGESDHVRRRAEVPVLVGPEFARCADACLHFVDDEEDVGALGQVAEPAEEGGGGVVVAAFGLHGLDDYGGGRGVEFFDETLGFVEAALFFGGVLGDVLVKGVFKHGKGGLGPVEGGNVELVDGLGACRGETAKQAAVEAGFEGENGKSGRARRLVVHGRGDVFSRELGVCSTALLLASPHEGGFVGKLIGIRARLASEDLVQPLGCYGENAALENVGPVVLGEVSQGWSVDNGRGHFGGCGCEKKGGVVVAYGDRGNLSVYIEQNVAVQICNAIMTVSYVQLTYMLYIHTNCRNYVSSRPSYSSFVCQTPCLVSRPPFCSPVQVFEFGLWELWAHLGRMAVRRSSLEPRPPQLQKHIVCGAQWVRFSRFFAR